MYKFSINKELFENILLKKTLILEKENTQFKKIVITNGLGNDKPQIVIECLKVDYFIQNGIFEFHLGKILEQKNIGIVEQNKDKIIEQLLEENKKLREQFKT